MILRSSDASWSFSRGVRLALTRVSPRLKAGNSRSIGSWPFPAKRRGMGKIVRAAASRSGWGPDAPVLPVAAERGGQHLLARGGLGAELRRDAGRAVHDVVLQPAEPFHFDLHHVARLDR